MRRLEASPVPAALLAYVGVTVIVPALRGRITPEFVEHALTVLLSAALLGGAWRGLSRLRTGPPEAGRDPLARGLLLPGTSRPRRSSAAAPSPDRAGGQSERRRRHSQDPAPERGR